MTIKVVDFKDLAQTIYEGLADAGTVVFQPICERFAAADLGVEEVVIDLTAEEVASISRPPATIAGLGQALVEVVAAAKECGRSVNLRGITLRGPGMDDFRFGVQQVRRN